MIHAPVSRARETTRVGRSLPLRAVILPVFWCIAAGLLGAPSATAAASRITAFAGTGEKGYSGDGGRATEARLNNPYGLTRGPDGSLYFCDVDNHVIRRISRDGIISTVVGTGRQGYTGDGGPAREADLYEPYEVRFDKSGNLFFVDRMDHVVRRVDARSQAISTIAGTGRAGFSGDGGPAVRAELNQPHSLQLGPDGDVFICDILKHRLRRVDMKTGVITTFAGTGARAATPDGAPLAGTPLNGPRAIAFDRRGDLWLALREGNAVYRVDPKQGVFHHEAGTGKSGSTGDGGPAQLATLSGPKGVCVAPDGNVYFTDTESHSIRMIDTHRHTVELVAGTGERGDGPMGDPLACRLSRPHGIFVDADGSVFVGDSEANRILVIRSARGR